MHVRYAVAPPQMPSTDPIRRPIKTIVPTRRWTDLSVPLMDVASIIASAALVRWAFVGSIGEQALTAALLASVLFLLFGQLTSSSRRGDLGSPDRELATVLLTWSMTATAMLVFGFLTRGAESFARSNVLTWFAACPAVIGLGRMCTRVLAEGMIRRGYGVRRVAIAGLNPLGIQTAMHIGRDPSLGLEMVGYYDDRVRRRELGEDAEQHVAEVRGRLSDLVEAARRGEVDHVMVTLPMRAEGRIRGLLENLSDTTASVYIVPDFFVFELLHSRWTNLNGLPAVSVFENPLFGVDGSGKRAFDILLAFAALFIAAVPMMLIAVAIKVTSRGPVFFRQKRYGLDGREILVWKFRSMRTTDNGPVVRQATRDDPRITPLGGFLRRTSLDEFPQLFNVLEGSMSLVGPRPHATAHNEQYRGLIPGYMLRHKVKPGITGLAQVNGCRGETETVDKMQQRVKWDHHYIRSWSLWLDAKIMIRTLLVAWNQKEAY